MIAQPLQHTTRALRFLLELLARSRRSLMQRSRQRYSGLFHRRAGCAHQPRHTYPW